MPYTESICQFNCDKLFIDNNRKIQDKRIRNLPILEYIDSYFGFRIHDYDICVCLLNFRKKNWFKSEKKWKNEKIYVQNIILENINEMKRSFDVMKSCMETEKCLFLTENKCSDMIIFVNENLVIQKCSLCNWYNKDIKNKNILNFIDPSHENYHLLKNVLTRQKYEYEKGCNR